MNLKSKTYLIHYKTICLIGLLCCSLSKNTEAQDIHFSNWNMSPLNLNSANTGMFDGDGRFIMNYRNQWKSVQVPYNSFSFGADYNLQKSFIRKTNEAIGIIFNHDVAGDGNYKINELKIPINHKLTFNNDSSLVIGIGVLAGISNICIDLTKLSFDKQWDGDAYNAGLSNGELFPKQSKTYADLGIGTILQKKISSNFSATIGYAMNHINKPTISFYNTSNIKLRMKHSESIVLKYSFSNISNIQLEYYANQQQKFRENLIGLSYYTTIEPKTNTVVNAGLLTRLGDALISTVGIQHNSMRFQFSYDYNYSQFKRATNGKGAFEMSFIYIYSKRKLFVPKTRVCPIYM